MKRLGIVLVLLASSVMGQQVIEYGVNPPWTPSELDGLALWLDAADSSTMWSDTNATAQATNNGLVARWDDKSGNDRAVIQGSDSLRPTWAGGYLAFTDHWLKNSSYTVGTNIYSTYIVFDSDVGSGAGGTLWISGGSSISEFLVVPSISGYRQITIKTPFIANAGVGANVSGINNLGVFGAGAFGSSLDSAFVSDNGLQIAVSESGALGYLEESGFSVGKRSGQDASPFVGNMGEIILTHTYLDSGDRELVEGYLAHKWGLTNNIPTNHPYKTESPYVVTVATNQLVMLQWDAESAATNYVVYLGSVATNLQQIASTTNTSLEVDLLEESQPGTMYWRVDVQTESDTVAGLVSSFVDAATSTETRYVDINNATPEHPFLTTATAATSIDGIVPYIRNGETILVYPGTYQHDGRLDLGEGRTYKSVEGAGITFISGLVTLGTNSVLDGFTFQGVSGGAVDSKGTVRNCRFLSNTSALLYVSINGGVVENCTFENNVNTAGYVDPYDHSINAYNASVYNSTSIGLGGFRGAASFQGYSYNVICRDSTIGHFYKGADRSVSIGSILLGFNQGTNSKNTAIGCGGDGGGGANAFSSGTHTDGVTAYNYAAPIRVGGDTTIMNCFTGTWGWVSEIPSQRNSPGFRDSVFYEQVTKWDLSNTGTNFVIGPRGVEGLRPLGGAPIRKAGQGALDWRPGKTREVRRIITGRR